MRTIIRVILVLIILGMIAFGVWSWVGRDADYYWERAQKSIKAEDYKSAEPDLRNLLKLSPQHAEGHQALATVILEKAKEDGQPADYLNNREALNELAIVAGLRPDDAELQKQLLTIYMRQGRLGDAVDVAERVLKLEPDNTDALYVLAYSAAKSNNPRAGALLERLMGLKSLRPFQTLELAEDFHHNDNKRRQEVLSKAVQTASQIEVEQLAVLSTRERAAMSRLLYVAVDTAPDAESAEQRVEVLLSTLNKTSTLEGANAGETADGASQAIAILEARHPLPEDASPLAMEKRKQLADKAQAFRKLAVEAGKASPAVYYQIALDAFSKGEYQQAVEVLLKGIEAAKELPPERQKEQLPLQLLEARSLLLLRRYGEATVQLDAILKNKEADKNTLGWAHLLAGGVNTAAGRHEKSLQHYLSAQQQLGQSVLVQMALANTNLLLKRWSDALPYLALLRGRIATGQSEERFWAAQHNITDASIDWGQARAYLALNKWEDAKTHLDALRGTKYEARATAMACLFLWSQGERAQAQQRLSEGLKKFPSDLTLLQVQIGFLKALDRVDDADQLITQVAAAAPNDLTRQLMLVRWQIARGNKEQAMKLLDDLETRFADDPAPRVLRAQILLADGESAQALAIANELQKSPKTKAVGSLIAAAARLNTKDLAGAAEQLRTAQDNSETHGALSLLQGRVAVAQGDYAAAVDSLSNSLDVTALRGQSRFELLRSILLLAQKEGLEEAERHLTPVLEQHPEDPFPLIILADLRFKQGKFQEGMQILDKVDRLQPGLPNAAYLKAGAYLQVGQFQKALEELRRALEIDKRHLPSLVMAAELSLATGDNRATEEYTREALAINGQLWNLYLVRADALNNEKRFDEAVKLVESVIKKQPKFLQAHRGLIALFNANKRPELALKACQRARELLPDAFVLVTDEMALRYQKEGLMAAQQVAAQATAGEVDAAKLLAVGRMLAALGEFGEAEKWGDKALAAADENQKSVAHLFLGEMALIQAIEEPSRKQPARDHFAKVLEFPYEQDKFYLDRFVAGNNLAWLLATEFDEPEEAVKVVEQVRGKWGIGVLPVGFLDTLAEVYRRADRLDEAREVLDQALETRPDEAKLLYQRGLLLVGQNRFALARTDLDRALQLGLPKEREEEAAKVLREMDQANQPTPPKNASPQPAPPSSDGSAVAPQSSPAP